MDEESRNASSSASSSSPSDSPSTAADSRSGQDDPSPPSSRTKEVASPGSRRDSLASSARHLHPIGQRLHPVVKIFDTDKAAPNERLHLVHLDAQGSLPTLPLEVLLLQRADLKDDRQILVKKDMKVSHLCRRPRREVKEIPPHGGSVPNRPLLLVVPRFRPRPVKIPSSQEGAQGRNLRRTQVPLRSKKFLNRNGR